jgi:hypothetical protein
VPKSVVRKYLNPARDYILVSATLGNNNKEETIVIRDAIGNIYFQGEMNESELQINVSEFNAGFYWFSFGNLTYKFVKM